MTSIDMIFNGLVVDTEDGEELSATCYDVLSSLAREHVLFGEGEYYGMDAGAIFKDIVAKSGNSVVGYGGNISTGVIVDAINLTDSTRLDAMSLLLSIINGGISESATPYHFYAKNGKVILAPYPDFSGDNILELTDDNVKKISKKTNGYNYYNCATVIGKDGIRGYFPHKQDSTGEMIDDFPSNPRYHKLITEYSEKLVGVASCSLIARSFVRKYSNVVPDITCDIHPDRYDLFTGMPVYVESERYGINRRYRIADITWEYGVQKTMTLTLSEYKVDKLSDFVAKFSR